MADQKHRENGPQIKAVRILKVFSIIIFFITLIAGFISDSMALLLDAATEFIIVFMSFFIHSNIRKIEKPPDQFFHFGYDKLEPFTVVMQGTMIMLSCVVASYFAIQDIIHADNIDCYDIPIYASVISGIIALLTAFYIRNVSSKTHSHMLKTSALHCFVDSILSFGMAVGFTVGFYMHRMGYTHLTPYVDPVMTLILAVILVWTPVKLLKSGMHQLLDAAPSRDVCDSVEKIAERHKAKAFGVRSIRMRKAGERVFLYICFEIHGHTTMNQAQEFVKSFENDISKSFPKYDVIVYFYPAAGHPQ